MTTAHEVQAQPDPAPTRDPLGLTATDRERCDRIRELDAQIAALAPTDPAIYALVAERNELRQDLVFFRAQRKRRA